MIAVDDENGASVVSATAELRRQDPITLRGGVEFARGSETARFRAEPTNPRPQRSEEWLLG
jgi:hypothetical protein